MAGNIVMPHVNIYCNGERKLAIGYDPTTSPALQYPQLQTPSTDFWNVAEITAHTDARGVLSDCDITPVHSRTADPQRDGTTSFCVDTSVGSFVAGGAGYPSSAAQLCHH